MALKKVHVYLVTGAAGFIGSKIVLALTKQPDTQAVIGIDNLNDYYSPEIKTRRVRELQNTGKFTFYKESILNENQVRDITKLHKPTTLIHTAAEVGVRNSEKLRNKYFLTNVMGTISILEACLPYVSQSIIFSSSSVYGNTKKLPFKEDSYLRPDAPVSVYGASKLAMEIAVKNFTRFSTKPTTIVRPFSVYGPDGRPDMLPMKLLISAATRSPVDIFSPKALFRDWTYIDDVVNNVVSILNNPKQGLRTVNIGNGLPIRLDKILHIIEKIISQRGLRLRYKAQPAFTTEMVKTWADTTKLKNITGNTKATDFHAGFAYTADFFWKHIDLYV